MSCVGNPNFVGGFVSVRNSKTLRLLRDARISGALDHLRIKLGLPSRVELSWKLGLGLPGGYSFLYITSHSHAHNALFTFLQKCGVASVFHYLEDGFTRYKHCYELVSGCSGAMVLLAETGFRDDKKFFRSIKSKVPALVVMRDPIALLKSWVNRFLANARIVVAAEGGNQA